MVIVFEGLLLLADMSFGGIGYVGGLENFGLVGELTNIRIVVGAVLV